MRAQFHGASARPVGDVSQSVVHVIELHHTITVFNKENAENGQQTIYSGKSPASTPCPETRAESARRVPEDHNPVRVGNQLSRWMTTLSHVPSP